MHYVSIKFLYWSPFSSFLSNFFSCIKFSSLSLTCMSFEFSVVHHIGFYLVSEFLFFVLFQRLWMLVTVNKAKFSPQETSITFSKTPAWVVPCIRLSLHHEKYLKHSHSQFLEFSHHRLLLLLLFFLKHMACLVFTHKISNWSRYLTKHFFCLSELSHTCLA